MSGLFPPHSEWPFSNTNRPLGLIDLAGLFAPPPPPVAWGWIAVRARFSKFHTNLCLTQLQQNEAHAKRHSVVSCLNRAYRFSDSGIDNSFFVGSWGKNTAIRPPRDVDIYYVLPSTEYERFQSYAGNRQSALLQDVKAVLASRFSRTELRQDRQIVLAGFDGYDVEVVPAFTLNKPGRYWICDTQNGGSYKETAPWDEASFLDNVDTATLNNLRPLIRMLKAWQTECSVPLKSFQLELLAADFLAQSEWRFKDWFYFDWILRDFFNFLRLKAFSTVIVPGTYEIIYLGNDWLSRAETAYARALKACAFEASNQVAEAGEEWMKIFGADVPRVP